MNSCARNLAALAAVALTCPAFAEHKGVPHEDEHAAHHAHAHHAHGHEQASADEPHLAKPVGDQAVLKRTDAIAQALSVGGEPVVVDVLGVVCDFCAKAMNKTFGKRAEVAAVHVDLDEKTLSLVLNEGASLSDQDITKLVRRSGYRLTEIRRGAVALGTATP